MKTRGDAISAAICSRKTGGRPSGPAADLDFSLDNLLKTLLLENGTKFSPESTGNRSGNGGARPSCSVNAEAKNLLRTPAWSPGSQKSSPRSLLETPIPDLEGSLRLTMVLIVSNSWDKFGVARKVCVWLEKVLVVLENVHGVVRETLTGPV